MWEFLSSLLKAVLPALIANVGGAAVSSVLQPSPAVPTASGGGGGGPLGGGAPGSTSGLAGAGSPVPTGVSSAPFAGGGPLASNNLAPGETPPTGTGGGFRTLPAGQRRQPYQTL